MPEVVELPVVAPLSDQLWIRMPQLSLATGLGVFTEAEQFPASVPTLILAGQVMTGTSVSLTVILKEQLLVPQLFVTVSVTVVVPLLNADPLPLPVPLPVVAPLNEYVRSGAGIPFTTGL